jgi:hypothetical protein
MSEPSFVVRPYLDADAVAVTALWRRVFPSDQPRHDPAGILQRRATVSDGLFLVGALDGRVVGTVVAGWDGYRGWLYHVAVEPDLQRRGLGRRLVEDAVARLRALGCPKVNLQVEGGNASVVAFYEALGFAVEDRISMGRTVSTPGPGASTGQP